jgi:hypothetical protein
MASVVPGHHDEARAVAGLIHTLLSRTPPTTRIVCFVRSSDGRRRILDAAKEYRWVLSRPNPK